MADRRRTHGPWPSVRRGRGHLGSILLDIEVLDKFLDPQAYSLFEHFYRVRSQEGGRTINVVDLKPGISPCQMSKIVYAVPHILRNPALAVPVLLQKFDPRIRCFTHRDSSTSYTSSPGSLRQMSKIVYAVPYILRDPALTVPVLLQKFDPRI